MAKGHGHRPCPWAMAVAMASAMAKAFAQAKAMDQAQPWLSLGRAKSGQAEAVPVRDGLGRDFLGHVNPRMGLPTDRCLAAFSYCGASWFGPVRSRDRCDYFKKQDPEKLNFFCCEHLYD